MIGKNEILKLADLSRLKLTDEEKSSLTKDLQGIFDYIEQLKDAEVLGSETADQPLDLKHNVLREDTNPLESNEGKFLKPVGLTDKGYVKVKAIF